MTWAGFIRGINIGGHKKVAMADLRTMLGRMGLTDVRTLLQSGNVVFGGAVRSAEALEGRLEAEMEKRLGIRADWFVRNGAKLAEIVARNPFRDQAKNDPGHLVVMFLKDAPSANAVKALQASISGPEEVRAHAREAYVTYPAGQGTSLVTITAIEKALGTRATGRNWNTVTRVHALLAKP